MTDIVRLTRTVSDRHVRLTRTGRLIDIVRLTHTVRVTDIVMLTL